MKYVKEGNKMKRPDDCPDILFDLMSECWHIVPDERPTFLQICQRLVGDANERFRRTSFFLTPEGREAVINQEEMLQVGGLIVSTSQPVQCFKFDYFSPDESRRRRGARTPTLLSLPARTVTATPGLSLTSWWT